MKYRKKPVVIEAIQLTEDTIEEILNFTNNKARIDVIGCDMVLVIPTLEGDHIADFDDYIIKGVKGEFYPCKPDIFEQTYEKV